MLYNVGNPNNDVGVIPELGVYGTKSRFERLPGNPEKNTKGRPA